MNESDSKSPAGITLSAEALALLAGGALGLAILAFTFGRLAERNHRELWGDETRAGTPPGLGRPEPLPDVRVVAPEK